MLAHEAPLLTQEQLAVEAYLVRRVSFLKGHALVSYLCFGAWLYTHVGCGRHKLDSVGYFLKIKKKKDRNLGKGYVG